MILTGKYKNEHNQIIMMKTNFFFIRKSTSTTIAARQSCLGSNTCGRMLTCWPSDNTAHFRCKKTPTLHAYMHLTYTHIQFTVVISSKRIKSCNLGTKILGYETWFCNYVESHFRLQNVTDTVWLYTLDQWRITEHFWSWHIKTCLRTDPASRCEIP